MRGLWNKSPEGEKWAQAWSIFAKQFDIQVSGLTSRQDVYDNLIKMGYTWNGQTWEKDIKLKC